MNDLEKTKIMRRTILFKILRILGGVIIGSVFLILGLGYYILDNICDREIVESYKSPDGTHEVVYKADRCGAISEDVGHIVLDGKEIVRMRLGHVSMQWTNNHVLHIQYTGITVPNPIKEYNGVQIDFVRTQNPDVVYSKNTVNSITDPRYVYLSESEFLYRIDVDLNNDRLTEALISNPKAINGKAGLVWEVFINNGDGTYSFSETGEYTIDLNPGAAGYNIFPGDSTKSLITYHPSNSTSGALISYRIENGKVVVKTLKIEPIGKDEALYKKLIKNLFNNEDSNLKITEIPSKID